MLPRMKNIDALEKQYGAFGPVLRALIELEAREESLDVLGINVCGRFLSGKPESLEHFGHPRDLLVFLDTRSNEHAAFYMKGEHATLDARPICIVRVDAPPCRIVAPNLADFLGLATIAGVEEIDRDKTDVVWRNIRHERLENDVDGEFERLSALVCAIPGVVAPALPALVTHAHPDVTIEDDGELAHTRDMHGPPGTPLERIERVWTAGNHAAAEKELLRQIETWLGIADMVHASNWRALESLVERLHPALPAGVREKLRAAGVRLPS